MEKKQTRPGTVEDAETHESDGGRDREGGKTRGRDRREENKTKRADRRGTRKATAFSAESGGRSPGGDLSGAGEGV